MPEMVNHPDHYTRGPFVQLGDNPDTTGRDTMTWIRSTVEYGRRVGIVLECIDVIRHVKDGRLFNAMKYVWRVAFGGKPGTDDREDIQKAIWYLNDWLDNPLVPVPTPIAVLTVDSKMSEARREKLQQEFEAWQRSGPA